jgi:uncharacterized lipoprotein YbaY
MKKFVPFTSLVLLALALSACATQPTQAPATAQVTGVVTTLERVALDPQAVIEVQLLDTSRADASAIIVASQTIPAEGKQVPIPFELVYDPAQIDTRNTYQVSARITVNGELRWINTSAYPVITRGNPTSGIEVLVSPVGG